MDESINVFGESLLPCSEDPLTGFFRDGCCNTSEQDAGSHTVCVEVTRAFLEFVREGPTDRVRAAVGFPRHALHASWLKLPHGAAGEVGHAAIVRQPARSGHVQPHSG